MDKELESLIEITDEDIDKAIAEWESNPPDKDYANILLAEDTQNGAD